MRLLAFIAVIGIALVATLARTGPGVAVVDKRPFDPSGFVEHGDPPASEALLSSIASRIAERRVSVRCSRRGLGSGFAGVVRWTSGGAGDSAVVSPQVCRDLGHLLRGMPPRDAACAARLEGRCGGAVEQVAFALTVLAHESYHLYGIYDEAQTECYALQAVSFAAVMLGAPRELGRALAAYSWRNHYPLLPADYRTEHCADGGRFDLRPHDPAWPG